MALETSPLRSMLFGLMSPEIINALSVCNLGGNTSSMNPAMGTTNRSTRCVTCHGTNETCAHHGAQIDYWIPIIFPYFVDILQQVFRCICLNCSHLLRPLTPSEREKILALPVAKRLSAYAYICRGITFCGAPVQQAEHLQRYREEMEQERLAEEAAEAAAVAKAEADAAAAEAAAEALAEAAAKAAADATKAAKLKAAEEKAKAAAVFKMKKKKGNHVVQMVDEKEQSDEEEDEDNEDDNDNDAAGDDENEENEGLVLGNQNDDDEDADGDEDENNAEGEGEAEEDEGEGEENQDDDDDPGDDDLGSEDNEADDEEEAKPKRRPRRKARKPKKKKKPKTRAKPTATGTLKKPRNYPVLMVGDFDAHKLDTHGCGCPVPTLNRDGLTFQALYHIVYNGDYDKRNWPKYNAWMVYCALRGMSSDDQELLGLNWEISPARALMPNRLHVQKATASKMMDVHGGPPVTPDRARELSQGGNDASLLKRGPMGLSKDEPSQEIKDLQNKVKRLLQKLADHDISTHEQLPSQFRSVCWVIPSETGSSLKYVKCDCKNRHYCECILRATKQTEQLEIVRKHELELLKHGSSSSSNDGLLMPPLSSSPSSTNATTKRTKSSQKDLEDLLREVGTALVTCSIGEINRKGAGRRDGPKLGPSSSSSSSSSTKRLQRDVADDTRTKQNSWQAGANNQNAAERKQNSMANRLVGKRGTIRQNVYGKRCDHNGRTVASGSGHLELNQVGVPKEMAEHVTVSVKLQPYNKGFLIDQLRWGNVEAIFDRKNELMHTRFLGRDMYVPDYGVACERHIMDGDLVLLNRQPTLHKPSIQGKRVKVWSTHASYDLRRTADANQLCTTSFNLDFDGDELNLHFSQGVQSDADIAGLMMAEHQILSQHGDCVNIGLVQNSKMGVFRLTDPDTWFTRAQFQHLLFQFQQFVTAETTTKFAACFRRAIEHPPVPADPVRQRYSGLQLFSALLPCKREALVNGTTCWMGVAYQGIRKKDSKFPPPLILDSVMLSGQLLGEDVAPLVAGNLVHALVRDVGKEITVVWLAGIQRVLNAFLCEVGNTIGPADYEMDPDSRGLSHDLIRRSNAWCSQHIKDYDMRRDNLAEHQTKHVFEIVRKAILNNLTGDVLARGGGIGCRRNGTNDMIDSGAKGKPEHLVQMGAQVGQQYPQSGRVQGNVAYFNRTMHSPEAHGYVEQSYWEGVSPWGFFCDCIKGRKNLVAIGSSVPTVGYFQNRLCRAQADVVARPDGSVRGSQGHIVEKAYGDDGFDPAFLESNGLQFLTPHAHASPRLAAMQDQLMQSRHILYEMSKHMPKSFLAPVHFARLWTQAMTSQSMKVAVAPWTPAQNLERVDAWYREMMQSDLLFPPTHHRYNLLLDTLVLDALSDWNMNHHHKVNPLQLNYILSQIRTKCHEAKVKPGEAVGLVGSQAMGEPATQMTLNSFHLTGETPAFQQMNNTANACKKPANAQMTVILKAPWNSTHAAASRIANSLVERRLHEFTISQVVHRHSDPFPPGDREWVASSLQRMDADSRARWTKLPSVRIEFHTEKCREARLSMIEIVSRLMDQSKRTLLQMNNGFNIDCASNCHSTLVMYVCQLTLNPYDTLFHNYVTTQGEVRDLVRDCLIRGLSKVLKATPEHITRQVYDFKAKGTREIKEWAVITNGSNIEELLRVPAVSFEESRTSYIYDAQKIAGIQGSKRWLESQLEELTRGSESRVDTHYTKLIADWMTRTGTITPMTRNGVSNSTESSCRLLFENILENLKQFGRTGARDSLQGVPEAVLMGNPPPAGTGFSQVELAARDDNLNNASNASNFNAMNQAKVKIENDHAPVQSTHPSTPTTTTTQTKQPFVMRQVACGKYSFSFFQRFVPLRRDGELGEAAHRVLIRPANWTIVGSSCETSIKIEPRDHDSMDSTVPVGHKRRRPVESSSSPSSVHFESPMRFAFPMQFVRKTCQVTWVGPGRVSLCWLKT